MSQDSAYIAQILYQKFVSNRSSQLFGGHKMPQKAKTAKLVIKDSSKG